MSSQSKSIKNKEIEFPNGTVPLNSRFYIERPPIEELAYFEISQPAGSIRIQGSSKMGKNSLLTRIIAHAVKNNYKTVTLDFKTAEESFFVSLEQFLRWFCFNISLQLELESKLDQYWDKNIGNKISCTLYLREYILPQLDSPLVLVLNDLHLIFSYPKIAQEFLPLLCSWHEEAKQTNSLDKLRIVLVYSTEISLSLSNKQFPFDIGLPLQLTEFKSEQVQELALRHGLAWESGIETKQLMDMVGGHPYLVRLALYYLSYGNLELKRLLEEAPTISGIYRDYLREYLQVIQSYPQLIGAVKQMVTTPGSVYLEANIAYQLESMGIIRLKGNAADFSCQLYSRYFSLQLLF